MPERALPSRAVLAAIAFAGHTPGLELLVGCRYTPRLVRVNVVAALLTVAAMVAAGVLAPAGEGGWAVLVAWLVGHFAWSAIFSVWILRGGAIDTEAGQAVRAPVGPWLRAITREPLVHFALVGAALFSLEHVRSEAEGPVPSAVPCPLPVPQGPIVVDAAVRERLAGDWMRTNPAPPEADQLDRLVQGYIDAQVLYREGLVRGLAEGDARVRQRVAAQMAYVLDAGLTIPEPTRPILQAWFRERADDYAQPERVDFTQVFVQGRDAAAEARARELLRLLDAGADPNGLGDTFSGGRRFRGRKLGDLSARFGDAFTAGLRTQSPGSWALRRSDEGLHLVRVDGWAPGRSPELEAVEAQVRHDWAQAQREQARQDATRALRERWEVVITP